MSSIVADELAKIKSFETDTEKRRSELTLNELNYISDKQLHKKEGGSGPIEWDFLAEITTGGSGSEINLLAGDFQTYYNKVSSESAIPVIGIIYDFSAVEMVRSKITRAIGQSAVSEDRIEFQIEPVEPSDTTQYWTITWSPDNSLELDTNATPTE